MGKLRFMPPVTPSHWSGVKSMHTPGSVCPQKFPNVTNESLALRTMTPGRLSLLKRMLPGLTNQSEDCLYLNIFAPASGKHRPHLLQLISFLISSSEVQWTLQSDRSQTFFFFSLSLWSVCLLPASSPPFPDLIKIQIIFNLKTSKRKIRENQWKFG